ncbi:hypothetical protein [uncultured Methanomethylovorans sp.]|uniref:hypothetical protein n=1 Tax=uncultured Methanomethylovorans sp. TaxID=183759 RepID=UPI003749211D
MEFYKFVELINKSGLYFTRVDNYEDLNEGRCSEEFTSFFEPVKKFTYANCWTQKNCESSVMWEAYGKDSEGIAIKSSVTRLRNCLEDPKNEQYIGKVTYDSSDLQPETNTLIPYFRKIEQFKDENEIRAIVQIMNTNFSLHSLSQQEENGIEIKVNLTELIESIYTSPRSSPDFIIKVKEIVSKHNLEKNVNKSEILYRHNPSSDFITKLNKIVAKHNLAKFMKKIKMPSQFNNSTNNTNKHKVNNTPERKMVENLPDENDCSGNFISINTEVGQYRGQKRRGN